MSLGPHLSRKVGISFIRIAVASVSKKRHGLHWECKEIVAAFLIEPVHEMSLKPVKSLPPWSRTIRKTEVPEYTLKIVLIEITYIPEHCLITPIASWHIHRVHHLLEVIVNDLHQSTLLDIQLHHLIKTVKVVVTIILSDEIVKIHKKLRCSYRTHKLGGDRINEINELPAE